MRAWTAAGRILVKMSARLRAVRTCSTLISPFRTCSRRNARRIAMCLLSRWTKSVVVFCTVAALSTRRRSGSGVTKPRSQRRICTASMARTAKTAAAMASASRDESATEGASLDRHMKQPPSVRRQYPNQDRWVPGQLAHDESTSVTNCVASPPRSVSSSSRVCRRLREEVEENPDVRARRVARHAAEDRRRQGFRRPDGPSRPSQLPRGGRAHGSARVVRACSSRRSDQRSSPSRRAGAESGEARTGMRSGRSRSSKRC